MNARDRALKLAIESLRDDAQRVAFDANLHDRYRSDCPVTVKASKHRKKLREAIAELEKILKESPQRLRRDNPQPLDYQQSPLVTDG